MALTTLEPIMQTVQNTVSEYLLSRGYAGSFDMVEAYPDEVQQPTSTMIVVAMADQSDRDEMELGGGLVDEEFTFTFDVLGFGQNAEAKAANIARQIKECFPKHRWIEVQNYTADPPVGSGEFVEVRTCVSARLFFQNAKVWQEHWHSVTLVVGYESVPGVIPFTSTSVVADEGDIDGGETTTVFSLELDGGEPTTVFAEEVDGGTA